MTAMEMSTEPSMFSWKEIQTRIPGRWLGRRKESQDKRMVDKLNLMKKEKKIETGTETIVGDVVGHQDGGEVPAVDESVCMGLYQNQLWFGARKMDWMAPRVEGLLEEAQTEAEEAVAVAEVVLVGEEEGFLLKEWEPLTQLIMQSQPTLMITMAIAVAIHGTTLATLNQMMEQVHGGLQQKSGELKTGMKIVLNQNISHMLYEGDWAWTGLCGTTLWKGQVQLSETKIFTASNVSSVPLPAENVTITAGQRIDLAVLLGKTPSSMENDSSNLDPSQAPSLAQPLVFSNSKQNAISQPASGSTFSHHSMVSMLGKGFGDVGEAKGGSTTGSQFLEQFKTAQALAQLAAQHSQSGSTTTSSWDMGSTTQSPSLVQYDLKSANDSTVHSPFTKRQAFTPSSTMMEVFLQEKPPAVATSTAAPPPPSSPLPSKSTSAPQMSPGSSDNQSSSPQPAQQKLKQQKKKTSLTSKIPALAVEMPGSADISGLNLQFGALQFGSEPVLSDYESTPTTSASSSQAPSSLYTSTASESSSTVSSNQSQESGYQSGPIQSTTYTSQNNAQGPLYEQRSTQTRRYPSSISSSPQKDLTQAKNGFSSVQATQLQTTQSVEGATGSAVKSESPSTSSIPSLNETVPAASLLTTANQHSSSLSGLSHTEEIPNTTTTQHSSALSTQQNTLSSSTSSGRTSTSTLLHTSVESEANLHSSSSTFSTTSSTVSAPPPVVSVSSSLNSGSSLGLSLGSNSTVTASTRSSVATTSGKAPPNLPPGVPPLLPNPYIMAPGLLHAYPPQVYGYDDLQMLQTRFPLDYYSIPFPTPTTPLTGRDGSLASNPYSGDLTKFGRGDASSPAPATTLAQPQQNQTQTHHTTQQTFLNPALPPGYSYTSLPYYTGVPGLPSTFQYGPAVFPVAPTSSKQHGVNVSVNASATPFQQPSGYGSHGYNTGVSVTSSNTGVPDISGSVYSKTQQSFEKQGFHSGTPAASFNLPSALGSGGPINPATAAAYPPAPFMHILTPHQQPHSQILHHHLQQDGQLPYLQMILCCQRQQEEQTGSGQRSQTSSIPQKPQTNKSAYNSYSWGAN
eukprot:XP_017175254.1 PREDICTED: ubiquitin-associated protein 2-like isoform X20 [Mus musculus]